MFIHWSIRYINLALLQRILSKNNTRVSNDLDPDQDQRSVTICKGYQQTTKIAAKS